jgi:hypothetical protein
MLSELWISVKLFVWGISSRFWYWLPFVLLDSTDLWDRYVRRFIRYALPGRDLELPPDTFLIIAVIAIICCGFLTFHELRQKERKISLSLEPNAEIDINPILQEWESPYGTSRAFYIAVRNPTARPLRGVTVLLNETEPRIPNLDWLPVSLHLKHDNREPHAQSFDLNPGGMRHVDLISKLNVFSELTIEHIIPGVNKSAPVGSYILTVRVEGADIAVPREAKYSIRVDVDGRLICLPASADSLTKGLLEFAADARKAAGQFPLVMTRLAAATSFVSEVSGEAGARIGRAIGRQPSIGYRILGINTNEDLIRRVVAPQISRRIETAKDQLKSAGNEYKANAVFLIENFDGYLGLAEAVQRIQFKALQSVSMKPRLVRKTLLWFPCLVSSCCSSLMPNSFFFGTGRTPPRAKPREGKSFIAVAHGGSTRVDTYIFFTKEIALCPLFPQPLRSREVGALKA